MLYYSQKTTDFYGREASREKALFEYRGFYEALVHSHLQFDVVHDGGLQADMLGRYKTVILPNVACLDENEIAQLDRFVEEWSNLIATYETALFDPEGKVREGFALNGLSMSVKDRRDMAGSYLLVEEKKLFKSFSEVDLMALNRELLSLKVESSGAVEYTGLTATPLVKNNTPKFAYWEGTGEEKGLVILRYGKGRIVYLPWSIGTLYHVQGVPEYYLAIGYLIDRLNGDREVLTNAPISIEVSLAEGKKGPLLHLLNATGLQSKPQTEMIPVFDVSLSF